MAAEDLVNILVHTDVTRYLEFKQISGSYVYRDGKIAKVRPCLTLERVHGVVSSNCSDSAPVLHLARAPQLPATEMEAMQSPLMGLFEKNRARKFFGFVGQYDVNNPKTHQGTAHRPHPKNAWTRTY